MLASMYGMCRCGRQAGSGQMQEFYSPGSQAVSMNSEPLHTQCPPFFLLALVLFFEICSEQSSLNKLADSSCHHT
jgi:hypothetical protein